MIPWQLITTGLRLYVSALAFWLTGKRRQRALEKRRLERFLHEHAGQSRARAARLTREFYGDDGHG